MSSATPLTDTPAHDARGARRGARILDSLVRQGEITPHGLHFLEKAMDPFHDTELAPVDLPDGRAQRVVLKEVNMSQLLEAPGAGTWDAHIAIMSDLFRTLDTTTAAVAPTSLSYVNAYPSTQVWAGTAVKLFGGVSWDKGTEGETTFKGTAGHLTGSLSPDAHIQGRARVVGAAFEVHNVTEELYKSGTVTCYRTATGKELDVFATPLTITIGGVDQTCELPRMCIRKQLPPNTESEALVIPGARQWAAEKGCYVVGVLDDPEVPFHSWDTVQRLYVSPSEYANATQGTPARAAFADTGGWKTATVGPAQQLQVFDSQMRMSGAYFTGLSPQTKLKLNAKFLIACQPDSDDPLITLARPVGPRDNGAIEIYSRAVDKLPPGVSVEDNAAGDWFRAVLGTIAEVAPKMGGALGAKGTLIGGTIGLAAAGMRNMIKSSEPEAAEELNRVEQAVGRNNSVRGLAQAVRAVSIGPKSKKKKAKAKKKLVVKRA